MSKKKKLIVPQSRLKKIIKEVEINFFKIPKDIMEEYTNRIQIPNLHDLVNIKAMLDIGKEEAISHIRQVANCRVNILSMKINKNE